VFALEASEAALADAWVRGGSRLDLQRRILRLGKPPRRWKKPPWAAAAVWEPPVLKIEAAPIVSGVGAGVGVRNKCAAPTTFRRRLKPQTVLLEGRTVNYRVRLPAPMHAHAHPCASRVQAARATCMPVLAMCYAACKHVPRCRSQCIRKHCMQGAPICKHCMQGAPICKHCMQGAPICMHCMQGAARVQVHEPRRAHECHGGRAGTGALCTGGAGRLGGSSQRERHLGDAVRPAAVGRALCSRAGRLPHTLPVCTAGPHH
jgi:hypothetical protein